MIWHLFPSRFFSFCRLLQMLQTQINVRILKWTESFWIMLYFNFRPDFVLVVRVFANGPGDLGSIPGRVIPKTQTMVLHVSLLNTQHYKVRIKDKVEQSRERSSALPLHLSVVAIEKGAFETPSTMVANFTFFTLQLSTWFPRASLKYLVSLFLFGSFSCVFIQFFSHEKNTIQSLF